MAYEIGYVDGSGSEGFAHKQMLLKIKTKAEANGWTTMRYDDVSAVRELILRGIGLSGVDEIYIGFRTYESVIADYYNLSVAGFTGYVPANSFDTQPGYKEHGIPAHNNRIDYWLVVNAQRVAFGLKVGTPVYESGYAGKFLPYATPSQYPYPVYVGGALIGIAPTRYSDVPHTMPYVGGTAQHLRFVDGSWIQPTTYPYQNLMYAAPVDTYSQLRDTNGTYPLIAVTLCDASNVFGELDGVYWVSGFNNAVENTFVIDGLTYVVMQNVWRTGFSDYYALRMQ